MSAIFMSHNEAILHLLQIITYIHSCDKRMGVQRGSKVAP